MTNLNDSLPSNLTCEICFEPFNLENHLPKSLCCCGKSICRACLQGLQRKYPCECPWCKTRLSLDQDAFKTNLQLLNVIEEDSKWEKCPKHGESMKLVCAQDKRKLCPYCGLNSECKNHKLFHFSDLKKISDERIKELEGSLEHLEDKAEKYDEIIGKNREIFEGIIEESFEKQIFELRKAKAKTLMKVNSVFNEKRNSVGHSSGQQEASLRAEVQAKIYEHLNFFKAKDPIGIIQEDMSKLKGRISSLIGGSQDLKQFEQHLVKMAPLFGEHFDKSRSEPKEYFDGLIKSLKDGMEQKKGSLLEKTRQAADIDEEIKVKVLGLLLSLSANSGILSCRDGVDLTTKTVSFKLSLIKKMRSVLFDFLGLELNEINLNAIDFILSKIPQLSRISLDMEFALETTMKRMSQLFSTIFRKPQDIQNIWISFPPYDEFVLMFNALMPQFSSLKDLNVRFFPGQCSLENCEDFAKNLGFLAPKLEKLDLNFSDTNFPISSFGKIFLSMPKLEEFFLNVNRMANFDDYALSLATRDMKKNTPKLQKFHLEAEETDVSSLFIQVVKGQLIWIPLLSIKGPENNYFAPGRRGMRRGSDSGTEYLPSLGERDYDRNSLYSDPESSFLPFDNDTDFGPEIDLD